MNCTLEVQKKIILVMLGLVISFPLITYSNEKIMISRNNYAELGVPVGPYVHATKHNGLLYSSGLTAFGTSAEDGNISEQTKEIFRQLEVILTAEQSGLSKLIKVTIFVKDLDDLAKLRDILFEIYGDNIPASSVIEVKRLFSPKVKIEIEAIAAY